MGAVVEDEEEEEGEGGGVYLESYTREARFLTKGEWIAGDNWRGEKGTSGKESS